MVSKIEISTIWAYLAQFDVTGNPSFLYSAWTLLSSLVEHRDIPDFTTSVAAIEFDGDDTIRYPIVEVGNENIKDIVELWVKVLPVFISNHALFRAGVSDPVLEASAVKTFQIAKMTLMKIMSAMGYVLNPFEGGERLIDQILSGEEE